MGFNLLGIDIFPAETSQEASSILDRLIDKNYNPIFLIEDIAENLLSKIRNILEKTPVSILTIPAAGINKNIDLHIMNKAIHKALGDNIDVTG